MKQKVLLCWNYERQSWVSPFEEVFKDDDYFFLNFYSRSQEKANFSKVKVHYWEDFKSIDQVLAELDPKIVVFMGLESPYALLLNYVCKQRGIPTYYKQHGIFHSYESYKYEERSMKRIASGNYISGDNGFDQSKKTFFTRSFKWDRLPIFLKIIGFLAVKKMTHSTQRALKFIAGENTQADHYIVYTKYLSRIFAERDNVPEFKFIEIGNPEANTIIDQIISTGNYDHYTDDNYLFIDEAFAGSPEYGVKPIVPFEQYNDFLVTLAEYALSAGKRLKVKLHPYSYSVDHFVTHPNIEYIKEADLPELIASTAGVFGVSSTLIIPALFVKSGCIFKLNDFSDIHKTLRKMNYCKVLDFHTFKREDIGFKKNDPNQQPAFIHYFLYKLDNKYMDRLTDVLHTNLMK